LSISKNNQHHFSHKETVQQKAEFVINGKKKKKLA